MSLEIPAIWGSKEIHGFLQFAYCFAVRIFWFAVWSLLRGTWGLMPVPLPLPLAHFPVEFLPPRTEKMDWIWKGQRKSSVDDWRHRKGGCRCQRNSQTRSARAADWGTSYRTSRKNNEQDILNYNNCLSSSNLIHLGATSITPFVHLSFVLPYDLLRCPSSLPRKLESICRTIRQEFREWHPRASMVHGRTMKRRALSKLKWPHFKNLFA